MTLNGSSTECRIVKWSFGFFRSAVVAGHGLKAVCLQLATGQ